MTKCDFLPKKAKKMKEINGRKITKSEKIKKNYKVESHLQSQHETQERG